MSLCFSRIIELCCGALKFLVEIHLNRRCHLSYGDAQGSEDISNLGFSEQAVALFFAVCVWIVHLISVEVWGHHNRNDSSQLPCIAFRSSAQSSSWCFFQCSTALYFSNHHRSCQKLSCEQLRSRCFQEMASVVGTGRLVHSQNFINQA